MVGLAEGRRRPLLPDRRRRALAGAGHPEGAATLRARPDGDGVEATAWGPGATWALDALPALLGDADDPAGFEPRHPALQRAHAARPHWRVGRGGSVWAALVPAVLEQKVTGQEAFAGYRRLLRRHGTAAPGPGGELGLRLVPDAERLRTIPSWEWLKLPADAARSDVLQRAARVAPALERTLTLPGPDADRALRSLPGLGVWTSAEIRQRAHGDADALSVGDYHVARSITWALLGEERDDAAMLELLEPYAGHRYRVQRLLELAGTGHPRRGARMAPRRHLPG
ncbi:DNA-3-methyladenine glycosylase family protein [Propioniciclava coleopterorum]|uniref:DNA-3-methyladenine glycosylase family protein n=1 Tax=Propioniciclava coleopterorum TaxID=2714937 RepID=UPI001FE63A36|nr:DNA-3-methyladenine glycosylase 2 family protein [Propioniciclava coleopterorum]